MSSACESNPIAIVMALADELRRLMESAAADAGLTSGQAQVLLMLEEPQRMGNLAERQTCDPSSVTAMVSRLERDGLVQRAVDPADARARVVRLTAKGRRVRERFTASVGDGSTAIAALSDDQRAALVALFTQSATR